MKTWIVLLIVILLLVGVLLARQSVQEVSAPTPTLPPAPIATPSGPEPALPPAPAPEVISTPEISIEIAPEPEGITFHGHVQDSTGLPVAGAALSLDVQGSTVAAAVSDAQLRSVLLLY